MSFQPFVLTWYTSMPRTMAAAWSGVYALDVAVWCTKTSLTPGA